MKFIFKTAAGWITRLCFRYDRLNPRVFHLGSVPVAEEESERNCRLSRTIRDQARRRFRVIRGRKG